MTIRHDFKVVRSEPFAQMLMHHYDGEFPLPLEDASIVLTVHPAGTDDKDRSDENTLAKDDAVAFENRPHNTREHRWILQVVPGLSQTDVAKLPEGAIYRIEITYKHHDQINRLWDGAFDLVDEIVAEEAAPAPVQNMDVYQQRLAERGL